MPEGVFAINRECRITYFSKRATEITGYTRKQVLGKPCYEIFRPEICQVDCSIKQSMATGKETFDHQVIILDRFNKALSVRIQTSPLRDEAGSIVGGLQTFHVADRPDAEVRKDLILFELRKKIGRHRTLEQTYEILPDLAKNDAPVLLQGEPGTGKRLLATSIHDLSDRRETGLFFHVLCKKKSRETLTQELMGTPMDTGKEGTSRKAGILEKAHRSTIFMEGIGALPYSLQVSLFKAMEDGVYMPIGAESLLDSDFRLIASTETDLENKVKDGTFRENLFYCLNVFKIYIPPLRERKEDIPLLARNILWHLSLEGGKDVHEMVDDTARLLQAYSYPGNVTELRMILEQAHKSARGKFLQPEDLPSLLRDPEAAEKASRGDRRADEARSSGQEKEMILAALIRNRWSRKRAAEELGMDRTTLWRKMKRMGLHNKAMFSEGEKEPKR